MVAIQSRRLRLCLCLMLFDRKGCFSEFVPEPSCAQLCDLLASSRVRTCSFSFRYILPDPAVGGPVTHSIGLVALLALRCFSIIAGCGCLRDGADPDGGAFFPVQHLHIYSQPCLVEQVTKTHQLLYQRSRNQTHWHWKIAKCEDIHTSISETFCVLQARHDFL